MGSGAAGRRPVLPRFAAFVREAVAEHVRAHLEGVHTSNARSASPYSSTMITQPSSSWGLAERSGAPPTPAASKASTKPVSATRSRSILVEKPLGEVRERRVSHVVEQAGAL